MLKAARVAHKKIPWRIVATATPRYQRGRGQGLSALLRRLLLAIVTVN